MAYSRGSRSSSIALPVPLVWKPSGPVTSQGPDSESGRVVTTSVPSVGWGTVGREEESSSLQAARMTTGTRSKRSRRRVGGA